MPIHGGCDSSQRSTTVTPSKKKQGRRRWIDQPIDRGFLGQERKPLGAQAPGHRFSLRMPGRGLGEQVSACRDDPQSQVHDTSTNTHPRRGGLSIQCHLKGLMGAARLQERLTDMDQLSLPDTPTNGAHGMILTDDHLSPFFSRSRSRGTHHQRKHAVLFAL